MSYTRVDNGFIDRLPEYSPTAAVLYLAIVRRIGTNEDCYPSISTLQANTGLARASICRAIEELSEKGALVITGSQGILHHYSLPTSSKSELVDGELVQNLNRTSSKSEPQQVQILDANNKQEKETLNKDMCGKTAYSSDFDRFWNLYPKKLGKKGAYREWQKAVKDTPVETIIKAAAAFAPSDKAQGEYCWDPRTWLSQGHWEDDPASWKNRNGNGHAAPPTPKRKVLTRD